MIRALYEENIEFNFQTELSVKCKDDVVENLKILNWTLCIVHRSTDDQAIKAMLAAEYTQYRGGVNFKPFQNGSSKNCTWSQV